ncbi:FAD binding domain of DNA photolyase family protein [Mycobacterium xenopi 4042]|uniref:FAD binding domain of DNA photolyase family protein n=1 Tax=Mycobacterium xenopi 4042 TaxID=1299334 RepID=X8DKC5_MYCXE|nr:FAD binding domain of DNA photolyase family protein [Mycobacterium xenopi 4042]
MTMALFTRDLRVHDNPVLTAAHRGGDAVVPVFVLDEAILSSDYVTPNKAAFLVDALTDLDDELRRRGGRLIVRRGQFVDEVLRVVDELSITDVHIAADVSAYSQRRERRLRRALAGHGCDLHVHAGSITVAEPGSIVPSGGDHFTVFTPYYRRWLATRGRKPLRAPTTLTVPHSRGEPIPAPASCAQGRLAAAGHGWESTGRRLLSRWLYTGVDRYDSRHDDLAADATSRLSPYLHFGCLSPPKSRTGQRSPARDVNPLSASWPGVTSIIKSSPRGRRRPAPTTEPTTTAGTTMRAGWTPGAMDAPAIPSSTPGCGSWLPKAGCTTALV